MTPFPDDFRQRYQSFKSGTFGLSETRYRQLADHGQSPSTMVVSCCDSRVDPEAIFCAGPGDLFVVRNVANLVPPSEATGRYYEITAALEFAVLNLKVQHIVVMGHSGCGGVKAAIDPNAAKQTDARPISSWMSLIDAAKSKVMAAHQPSNPAELASALELAAIENSLANLRSYSFISKLETEGSLALHGCHFEIGAGELSVLNASTKQFEKL